MIGNIGVPGLILVLVIALLIFGPKKLPEIGSAFGKTMKEFKKATNSLMDEEENTPSSEEKELKENHIISHNEK